MKESEMRRIAEIINKAIENAENESNLDGLLMKSKIYVRISSL